MGHIYPGIKTPITVGLALGLITYLVVFNLDLMLTTLRSLVSAPRAHLLAKIKEGKPKRENVGNAPGKTGPTKLMTGWPKRAKEFEIFPAKNRDQTPSDRWIAIFAVCLFFKLISNFSTAGLELLKNKFRKPRKAEAVTEPQPVGSRE